MANALPLILVGGVALYLVSGKKKKKKKSTKATPAPETKPSRPLPGVTKDEDLDAADGGGNFIPDPSPPTREPDLEPTPTSPVITPSGPAVQPDEPPVDPEPQPQLGPTGTGSCANPIYVRDPVPLAKVGASPAARTMFTPEGYYFHIRPEAQQLIFKELVQRFERQKNDQERRTVSSVILRETLKKYNHNCAWETPVEGLGEPEQLIWESARRLMMMAQTTVGVEDPGFSKLFQTGERFTVSRDALGDPDPGFMTAQKKPDIGQRVEIIATDKTLEHAEHIIGKIERITGPNGEPNLFEIRIVDTFQGEDVKPRLRTKHGFKAGSNAFFSQKGPTGIYRIFPQGMV